MKTNEICDHFFLFPIKQQQKRNLMLYLFCVLAKFATKLKIIYKKSPNFKIMF